MGSLFVFNPTISFLALAINDEQVGSLRPCPVSSYKPFGTSFGITKYEEPGSPHLGENTLRVTFESEPRITYLFPFTLQSPYFSFEEDVVAFALRGCLMLTAQSGAPLKPNPLPIPALPFISPTNQHPLLEET
jgi:hypothetical protein